MDYQLKTETLNLQTSIRYVCCAATLDWSAKFSYIYNNAHEQCPTACFSTDDCRSDGAFLQVTTQPKMYLRLDWFAVETLVTTVNSLGILFKFEVRRSQMAVNLVQETWRGGTREGGTAKLKRQVQKFHGFLVIIWFHRCYPTVLPVLGLIL